MIRFEKFLAIVVFGTMIAGVTWYKISVWNECRQDNHSRMYCLSLISK